MNTSCSVCKLPDGKRRVNRQCTECLKVFCPNHMHSMTLCWGCARDKMIHVDTPILKICALCGEEKEMDVESSLTYCTVLCYNCAKQIDEEYIKFAETKIKEVLRDGRL